MAKFVWLPAMEAGWVPMAINADQVSYLMPGGERDGEATTLVVFGQLVGALAHLRVKGLPADVAAALEGAPAAPPSRPATSRAKT